MTSEGSSTTPEVVIKATTAATTNATEPSVVPIAQDPASALAETVATTSSKSKEEPTIIKQETPMTEDEASTTLRESTQGEFASDDAEHHDLLSQLEGKVSSFWAMATEGNGHGEGLGELKQDILHQIASAKESLITNELLQSNVTFAENKLKELADRVKSTDVSSTFDAVSTRANKALDSLDSQLEIVEQQASKFVSLLTSFFSSMVVVKEEPKPAVEQKDADRSFSSILTSAYGNTRYDNDLHKLHTTEKFYLESNANEETQIAAFDVSSKTTEISALLEKYPDTLQQLMNKLVPVKIPYDVFWYRYFEQEQQLKQQEESRKKLLKKPTETPSSEVQAGILDGKAGDDDDEEDDDDFAWDDDE